MPATSYAAVRFVVDGASYPGFSTGCPPASNLVGTVISHPGGSEAQALLAACAFDPEPTSFSGGTFHQYPSGCADAGTLPCQINGNITALHGAQVGPLTGLGSIEYQAFAEEIPEDPGECIDGEYENTGEPCQQGRCVDGTYTESGESCVGEATCGAGAGISFTVANPYPGSASETQWGGYDFGCEYALTNCDETTCQACYTGNGTLNQQSNPPRRWTKHPTSIGNGTCPISEDPQPHPGFCEVTDPDYDAVTDSCTSDGELPRPDCDGADIEPNGRCSLTITDPETEEPVYSPPDDAQPEWEELPTNPTPPEIPDTNDGLDPGYTGEEGETEGGIGNNPGGVPEVNTNPGYTGGAGSASTEDTGSVSWGNLPTIPTDGFYDRQYEGGMAAVVNDRLDEMRQGEAMAFINGYRMRSGIGIEPEFRLDLTAIDMGVHEFGLYGGMAIWNVMKWVVLITALFYCRRIIFGG